MPPRHLLRKFHSRGGVRRATSARSAPIRPMTRLSSSIATLSLVRSGSGKWACVCCKESASAITRICLRLRGFSLSHSRRFPLRFLPSHSSPVPAGRPASGSAIGDVFGILARNMCHRWPFSAVSISQLICPSISTRPVTRSVRDSNTTLPHRSYASGKSTTSYTPR